MKRLVKILIPILALTTLLVSACTGAAAPVDNSTGSGRVVDSPIEFTGVIQAMEGYQWTVAGQVITVDPSLVGNGPFNVGDMVKVKAEVQADGSMVVTRVEAPPAEVNSNDSNGNDTNSNDANSNDDNGNDANSNDDNGNSSGLMFDNSGTEAFGTVDSITTDTVVIGGQTFTIANGAEFKAQILPGDFVKVHFSLNADGTLSITGIETWDPALVSDGNSNDNNGNDSNSNADNGNDSNTNGDDHGGNSGGGSDDNGGGNDDHGGGGGDDSGGGDDHGGGND